MICNCGTELLLGIRKYFIQDGIVSMPFYIGSYKCPTCLEFSEPEKNDFYLFTTLKIVKTFTTKINYVKGE